MSDYFGALLRSAGAAPADGLARRRALQPMAPLGDAAAHESLEQFVEIEAPASVAAVAGAPLSPEPPMRPPPSIDPDVPPTRDAAPARQSSTVRPAAQGEAAASPAAAWPAGDEAPVHPLVEAALRWVRADASAVAPRPTEPLSAPQMELGEPASTTLLRAAPAAPPLPDPPPQEETTPRRAKRSEPIRAVPVAVGELDLDAPRPTPAGSGVVAATDALPRAPSPAQVDVSIGTIHVRVDAPPAPRPVTPAPPPLARPPAAGRDSTRSSLSRSRLPRL